MESPEQGRPKGRWTPGRLLLFLVGILLMIVAARMAQRGPASVGAQVRGSEESSAARGAYVGELIGRSHRVRLYQTEHGPRYTVLDGDGEVLAWRVTAAEVRLRFPAIDVQALTAEGRRRGDPEPVELMLLDPGGD